ncbi:GGDEF domain-containing protein, diguanylate cyclase (c-di-GMP synthetase) or its enzymatically inactive variants [Polaromonas sp. OV174]|nr:GGDEF domain-containing protein, diguanylate cyclase (c-di-GMP synthetase) or its enzymatically inactive variants [Polaromonas sp. OV174]
MRGFWHLVRVFSACLAAGLLGLLLHGSAFAQAAGTGAETLEPQLIALGRDTHPLQGTRGEGWVLVDASGQMTFEQVRAQFAAGQGRRFALGEIMPTGGGRVLWFQLKLPAVASPTPLLLSVPHPNMDGVDLYRPIPPANGVAQWQVQRSGDLIPVAQWPVRNLYPAFELVLMPGESQPSYLRVIHSYPLSLYWTLSEPDSFQEVSKQTHLLLGIYIGLVLLMALISAIQAFAWSDRVHLLYAAYVLLVALGQLSLMGLGGEYLWPANAWLNDHAPVTLTLLGAAMLHLVLRQLIVNRDVPWLSRWLLLMALLGALVALAFVTVGRHFLVIYSTPYYVASMLSWIGVAAWYARRRPRVGLWVLAAVVCLVGGSTFPVLRMLSLSPMSAATQYGVQIGAALELPLLLIALYFRSHERRNNQLRVGSLTRVDPLTGVASHRVLLQRLAQLLQRQQYDPAVGAVLLIRISNAASIRQEYGMEGAQNAEVHAGDCITGVAQEGDTVARHRDGDFVLLLQGRVTHEQLSTIGQRLIAHGLADIPGLPFKTALQFKLAVAEAPFQVADATHLLLLLEAVLDELAARPGTALRFVRWPDAKDTAPAEAPV